MPNGWLVVAWIVLETIMEASPDLILYCMQTQVQAQLTTK